MECTTWHVQKLPVNEFYSLRLNVTETECENKKTAKTKEKKKDKEDSQNTREEEDDEKDEALVLHC